MINVTDVNIHRFVEPGTVFLLELRPWFKDMCGEDPFLTAQTLL